MTKTPKQYMTEFLIQFGRLFQLLEPSAEYIDAIYNALQGQGWTVKQFATALNVLTKDKQYAEYAKFGKYPIIYDFFRIKNQIESKPFYDALSAYLSGDWWAKDEVLALATPEQMNAIRAAGGLSKLYERANGDMATPVYKLVDIVSENESEAPVELIETGHRIGGPASMKQIMSSIKRDNDVNS